MLSAVYVALGGALGSVMRYLLSLLPYSGDFPLLTLVTNLLGALLIGIISGVAGKHLSTGHVLFLKTGVCGGFTTFSTFSLEAVTLLEQGKYPIALAYMGLSLVLSLAGVVLGHLLSGKIA